MTNERITLRKIRETCIKKESKFMAQFYRNTSVYPTWIFLRLPFTPNMITVISMLTGIFGCLLFLTGDYIWSIIGILFFQLGAILDYVDGNVARYRKQTSMRGEYLDSLLHGLSFTFLFGCLGIFAYLRTGMVLYIIIGLLMSNFEHLIGGLEAVRRAMLQKHGIAETNPLATKVHHGKTSLPVKIIKTVYMKIFDNRVDFATIFVLINQVEIFILVFGAFIILKFILLSYVYSIFPKLTE